MKNSLWEIVGQKNAFERTMLVRSVLTRILWDDFYDECKDYLNYSFKCKFCFTLTQFFNPRWELCNRKGERQVTPNDSFLKDSSSF